jgi:hypothetical protein
MWSAIRSRITYANLMATVAVFIALGGSAYAVRGVPDKAGVFHGCVDNKTGALRLVKSAKSCRKAGRKGKRRIAGESAVSWNERGRAGAPGLPACTLVANPGDGVHSYFARAYLPPTLADLANPNGAAMLPAETVFQLKQPAMITYSCQGSTVPGASTTTTWKDLEVTAIRVATVTG